MNNRCAFLDADHTFTLKTLPAPEPAKDEALIKIAANGICGSDVHFYSEGRLGNFVVDGPYIPGHEASGTVVKLGKGVTGLAVGDKVVIEPGIPCGRCAICRSGRYNLCPRVVFMSAPPVNGTFCDYVCVRADFAHKIPGDMRLCDAALAEPAAVAVHAVNQAGTAGAISGKSGLIYGMGTIGLMTLQAFKAMGGGHTTCVDMLDNRLDMAKKLGADDVVNAKTPSRINSCADVVFETAGSGTVTSMCFYAAKPGGTVVQVGWPAGNIVAMDIAAFIEKELTYKSVNRYANAFPAALRYIYDGRIDAKSLITQTYGLNDISEAFAFAKNNPARAIKIVVTN